MGTPTSQWKSSRHRAEAVRVHASIRVPHSDHFFLTLFVLSNPYAVVRAVVRDSSLWGAAEARDSACDRHLLTTEGAGRQRQGTCAGTEHARPSPGLGFTKYYPDLTS